MLLLGETNMGLVFVHLVFVQVPVRRVHDTFVVCLFTVRPLGAAPEGPSSHITETKPVQMRVSVKD